MNPIFAAALEIQEFCDAEGWKFCIIGGLAVNRWGEPRLTQDVDLTVLTPFGGEARFVERLLERFRGRRPDAREFALKHRVVLLEASNGIPLDVAMGALPFEERAVERASGFLIRPGVQLATCSAEDLVVFKAFAGRDQDWLDIEGIVLRQAVRLDEALIYEELTPLLELKGDLEAGERLRRLFSKSRD